MAKHAFHESVNQAVTGAAQKMSQARQMVMKEFGPNPSDVTVLSLEDQVKQFMSMTESDLQSIAATRGEFQLQRYIAAMLKGAKDLGYL